MGKFGQFWKNPKISALFEPGGGPEIGITQNFGKEFFSGTCNFLENGNFEKKNFRPEINPFPKCEIGFVKIGCLTSEIEPVRKKDFSKFGFFLYSPVMAPNAMGAEPGVLLPKTSCLDRIKSLKAF